MPFQNIHICCDYWQTPLIGWVTIQREMNFDITISNSIYCIWYQKHIQDKLNFATI